MKIGIISFSMMESSMPLAKNLSLAANVDLYCLLPQGDQNAYIFNFENKTSSMGFIKSKIVKKTLGERLLNYLASVNLEVYIFPNRWFQRILFVDFYYAYVLAKCIKKKKYDLIHIIHTSKRFWIFLYLFLNKRKVIQTLHEVTGHEAKTSLVNKWILKLLINNSTPIIFHSNASKDRFIQFRKSFAPKIMGENNLAMIRFGLYETYKLFADKSIKMNSNSQINILNFGRIVPYKGIDILIKAVKLLQDKYPIHLIVAGNGAPYFDFEGVKSFEFINRSITTEEVIRLIQECEMVVLPYTSASQSGVPMTVYCFNRPIIASNIGPFKEVIYHQKTGILVNNLNPETLACKIEELLINSDLRNEISTNIETKYTEGEFSWSSIAYQTLSFYNAQLIDKSFRKSIESC